ncbi:hypothetical protein EM308_10950 [Flavobacterium gilvum]|uniref:Uncharacterized protein n=2 Tax=Flavobacterium gilvum TaxID=1492737 RepID=A0AAC9N431_9FLAO|nr:hypothetical protein EM308_10950 [Flavobacterium gilvum]
MPHAFAANYYTASANATLAGNSGAVNANWTTNPDGTTNLGTVVITGADNLIILSGGTATITAAMSISALTINEGGAIIHNVGAFNIYGLLTWNGRIKSGGTFFNVNGDIVGTTAIHDAGSPKGIYLGGSNKTINLTQASGVVNTSLTGLLLVTSHALAGNCKWQDALNYNTTATLDLAGYNLEVSSIQGGVAGSRMIKGNSASNLTVGTTRASTIVFDPSAKILNTFSINNLLWPGASAVTIGTDLTVNSLLDFGVPTVASTRTLQVNGNFALGDNGTLHVQAKGTTAGNYDLLSVTGTVSLGAATTLKVDYVNFTPSAGSQFNFATSTGLSGTFSNLVLPTSYTGTLTYPSNTVRLTATVPPVNAYYTASPDATLAGNGTGSNNWTTNPDGTTGLTSITIGAGDNLVILDGGAVAVTATTSANDITINQGGTLNHLSGANCDLNIGGTLTWNGTIKTTNGGFFNANGNVTGTTAVHDGNSTRGIYLGGTNKTISLIQSSGVVNTSLNGLQLVTNHALAGNCKWHDALNYNANATLDLAGYNLEVSSIQGGTTSRLIKGNTISNLTIGSTVDSTIFFDPTAKTLNSFSINNLLWPGTSAVTIGTDLTVNSLLDFGVPTTTSMRILQVNGNFALASNGTMHVRAGGMTAGTDYDQLNVAGNISIGTGTALKVDSVNSFVPIKGSQFNFAASSGSITGTFASLQPSIAYAGTLTYPNSKGVTLTTTTGTYYTASPNATLAGNSGAVNANWTLNPDGITNLGTVAITGADNLVILSGGTATITAAMNIVALTINQGGAIIHNAGAFNIYGLLTWNGSIKSGGTFFNVNGDIIGTTAIHDAGSPKGIYLGGTNKTINLTQAAGVVNTNFNGFQLVTNHALAGNCKWHDALYYNTSATLDLAGYNLEVSSIQGGVAGSRMIKGNASSNLTIGTTRASTIAFDPSGKILNSFIINNGLWPGTSGVTIGTDLTVNSLLDFGVPTAINTRTLQVNGNFSLGDNGTLYVQAKGATAGSYDLLSVTGNITIGSSTTFKFNPISTYSYPTAQIAFVKSTAGTLTGSFATVVPRVNFTGILTYPSNSVVCELAGPQLPPPPPACSLPDLNPDIPLEASTPEIDAQINTIIQRFSDSYLGTTAPTAEALATAVNSYNALGITAIGNSISASGTPLTSYSQMGFLRTFAQQLKFNPDDTDTYTKALNAVWLVSERFCDNQIAVDLNQYDYQAFANNAILIPSIKDNFYVKSLFENVLYKHHNFDYLWGTTYDYGINIDHIGNTVWTNMCYVKWIDSADERYRYMKGFKRFMERFMSHTSGTSDGIKPDGSGFHHQMAYPAYAYDFNSSCDIVYYLRETSFQVSSEAYLRYRDAFMAQAMFHSENLLHSLSMSGRRPDALYMAVSRNAFRNLAIAGGSIMGTGASDPVLATYHNRIWGSDESLENSTIASFNEGYFQFNHSMAGVYRKDNWIAVCKGFSNNMFGTEAYSGQNRYGRYQSYGAVDIIYPGDSPTGNGFDLATWNWNYYPGTTVIRLPWDKLAAEMGRLDEIQQKRFVGSLSFENKNSNFLKAIHGTYGMFAMDFQEATGKGFSGTIFPENHNPSFVFKKSVFTFDNMLICLGSGIGNNDATNTTLTTLYQRKTTAVGKDVVNVDGNLLQEGTYDNNYSGSGNHWIVDNYGTGFYVFTGSGDVKLTRVDQQVPQHSQNTPTNVSANPVGNYAIGYIDHGTAPTNKGYEYVCMPKSSASDMTIFSSQIDAGNKPYTVHRKDEMAHIVEYKPTATSNSIFGYAFFSALSGINNTGQLTGADYPCLVMSQYDAAQKNLKLAVNNPDLGFVLRANNPSITRIINITIKGTNWQISQPNANASITGTANGETTIQFTTVDGLPVEIVLSRILTPQTITFEALPAKTTNDAAFDLTATASSGLPVSYTSSNSEVATVSGSTVTIVGKGTSTITAKQDGDDIYGAAEAVEQTLTVNPVTQTITFDAIPTKAISDPAFDLTATTSSNLPVSYISSNTDVATISGSTVTIVGKGTAIIEAFQEGNSIYDVATVVEQILRVNTEPTVLISSPLANASYDALANITIIADATDVDGSVRKVEFFQGVTKLGEATAAPYSFDWNEVAAGSYDLTAKATDNDGAVTTSEIVNVTVNALPVVSVTSPLANGSYNTAETITITAEAADTDGSVSKVEFFNGATKLGEDSIAPYSFDWNNVASDWYALTAKVTDNNGAVATSTVVSINVVCPTVQLSIPDVYAMNPAIDDVNTIYLGYGPTSLTLNSLVQDDQDYTYTWSTGAHTPSISVSEAGTYTVTASYAGGCQSTSSITINTLDVRCGMNNDKVMICHNNNVICVAQSAVQNHLNHGDNLGSCNGTAKMATKEEATNSSNFTVYPNPVQDNFSVSIASKLDPNATIGIYNILGNKIRQVRFTAVPQNVIVGDLPSGNYIIVVQNGVETFRSTIVKQ